MITVASALASRRSTLVRGSTACPLPSSEGAHAARNDEDKGLRDSRISPGIELDGAGAWERQPHEATMTQNKNIKAAIRARMAATGEPYTEAARHVADPALTITRSGFDIALQELGIPKDVLTLALRYCAETKQYPALGAAASERLTIFLDMKHWVALAKARLGRPEFDHDQRAYEFLRAATAAGDVMVPICATTYMEMSRNPRQSADVANVIAEIGGFVTIGGRKAAVEHQFRTALAARCDGPAPGPLRPFGLGQPFAFGDQRRLVLKGSDGAAPALPAATVRDMETAARVIGEYMMLRAPEPEEIPQLRRLGYRPEAVAQVEAQRLKREQELAAALKDGTTNRERLADIVSARYLYWELGDHLRTCLEPYGIDVETFFAQGKDWLTALLNDIPNAAITITLSEKGFRNAYKVWTGRDLRDSDATAAAIPYCDVVTTDKYVATQLAKSPAVTRLGTLVFSRLGDLNDALPDLVKVHGPHRDLHTLDKGR